MVSLAERKKSEPQIPNEKGMALFAGTRPLVGRVSLTCDEQNRLPRRMRDHAAETASCHWFAASARKIRSVERETRWRWRLKVLWTAACMLRNCWAE